MANVVETIYRFRADRSATSEVLRDNARIADTLSDIEQAADRVRGAYSDLEHTGVQAAQARIEALRTEIRLAREQADIYGDVGRRLMPLAGLTAGVGGAALSGRMMLAADILDATEALKLLRAELPTMAAQLGIGRKELVALGAAGAALAGGLLVVKAIFNDLAEASNQVRGVVAGQIDGYKRYSDFMQTATSETLKAEIEAVMQRDLADREYYENLLELRNRVEDALKSGRGEISLDSLSSAAIELYEALGGNATGLKDLEDALNGQLGVLESNRLYLTLLTQAYTEGATATNDAAERERLYTDRKVAGLEATMQREMEFQRLRESATSEQVQERLRAIKQEQAALRTLEAELEPLAAKSETAAQKLSGIRDRLAELELEAQGLSQSVLPAIQAMEKWRAGIEAMRTGAQQALQTVAQMAQRLQSGAEIIAKSDWQAGQIRAEAAAEREKAEQKHQERLDALGDQFRERREEAERAYQQQIGQMTAEFDLARTERRAEYEREETRRIEDFQRERERRERQHRESLLDAASRLDARSILEQQRQFAREEREAQDDFNLETRRRKEEFDLREQQEKDAFKRRLDQAEAAFREQERREREQYRRSIAQQNAAFQAELRQLDAALRAKLTANQSAMQSELAQLFGFQNTEYTVREEHYRRLKEQLQRYFGAASGTYQQALQAQQGRYATFQGAQVRVDMYDPVQAAGMSASQWYLFKQLYGYQRGGYTPTGPIFAHEGEFMLSPRTTRELERGLGVPLTQQRVIQAVSRSSSFGPITVHQSFGDVGRYSPRQIEGMVERAMVKVFQELGA